MSVSRTQKRFPNSAAGNKKSLVLPVADARARTSLPVVDQIRDLAWAGQHAQAIELATTALATAGTNAALKLDLLDLRAESLVALGDTERAGADAATMLELARAAGDPAFRAQALNRQALVQMRSGRLPAAVRTATSALSAARRSGQPALEAQSLLRLAEAQFRFKVHEPAAQNATRAAELFAALDQPAHQGRALWALSAARSGQGRAADADKAAAAALALGRRCGDLYGVGNALNMLMFNEGDIATKLKLLNQALTAFEASGYLERCATITYNLGIQYSDLGLYRRARRTLLKAREMHGRVGFQGTHAAYSWILATVELPMGRLDTARTCIAEGAASPALRRNVQFLGSESLLRGELAFREGDASRRAQALPARGEAAPRREAGRRGMQCAGAARAGTSGHG